MAATYEPISSTTLASAAATVDLTSIPATYTDLVLVIKADASANGTDVIMQFNSDTGSNYSQTFLRGNGSTVASGRYTVQYLNSASTYGIGSIYSHIIHVMAYSNTNVFKTSLTSTAYGGGDVARMVNLWRSTSAINSIQIKALGANFTAGSTFSLYGVKAA